MTEAHRVKRRKAEGEGPPFTLEVEDEAGEVITHEFQCRPRVSETVLLELLGKMAGGNNAVAGAAIVGLFEKFMEPPEYRRFRLVTDDPDVEIDATTLGEILKPLVEFYAKRPTKRPSASPDGPEKTTGGSPENSPSEG